MNFPFELLWYIPYSPPVIHGYVLSTSPSFSPNVIVPVELLYIPYFAPSTLTSPFIDVFPVDVNSIAFSPVLVILLSPVIVKLPVDWNLIELPYVHVPL